MLPPRGQGLCLCSRLHLGRTPLCGPELLLQRLDSRAQHPVLLGQRPLLFRQLRQPGLLLQQHLAGVSKAVGIHGAPASEAGMAREHAWEQEGPWAKSPGGGAGDGRMSALV